MSRLASQRSPHPRSGRRPRRCAGVGFTLVELMISVAIVLVLMLGINYVFSTSAKTISTGIAVTGVTREIRGARKVLEADFRNVVPEEEMPTLIIHNEMVYAWKDKQDKLTDADNNPATFDVDGAPGDEIDLRTATDPTGLNSAPWLTVTPTPNGPLPGVYNYRRHRIDRISFFIRNAAEPYSRQTGDNNTYISTITSPDAWIQYGLLRLADNNGIGYWKPGARGDTTAGQDEPANQNNFFTTQWILGRKLMLLKPFDTTTPFPGGTAYVAGTAATLGVNFGTIVRRIPPASPTPQNFDRESPPYPTVTPWRIEESRVDLVGVNAFAGETGSAMKRMRRRFDPAAYLPGAPPAYWTDADPTTTSPPTNRDRRQFDSPIAPTTINYLSWAKPYVNKSNFATSIADQTRETALTTPIFMRGVTQFIVEFAGDFYDQGPDPVTGAPEALGTIDFAEIVGPDGPSTKIRWYGLPRETDDTAGIDVADTRPLMGMVGTKNCAPLMRGTNTPAAPRFTGGTTPSAALAQKNTVSAAPLIFAWGPTVTGGNPVGGSAGPPPVVATAGAPNNIRPALIRITIEMIDPNGRLEDGQRIEYVFRMK